MQKNTGKDPQKHAAALRYNEEERIPRILAGGMGEIAEEIVNAAEAHGIPVRQDEALAVVLSRMRPGELIPPETYRLAAEVIAFLYDSDKAWRENHSFIDRILGKNSR